MEPTYLQWNIPNWITVVLMATVGMLVVGAIASGIRAAKGVSSAGGNDD
jgi:hypothetical protein